MKKKETYYYEILIILTILSYIFLNKNIYIAPSLNVSNSIFTYAFTFLILAFNINKYGTNDTRKIVIKTIFTFICFFFITTLICNINGIPESNDLNLALRETFTPEKNHIFNKIIYYPNLLNISSFIIVYFFSHFIFISIYDIITQNSNKNISFLLSLIIVLILDNITTTCLINSVNIFTNIMSFQELIKVLTANFISLIFLTLIMFIIFILKKKE